MPYMHEDKRTATSIASLREKLEPNLFVKSPSYLAPRYPVFFWYDMVILMVELFNMFMHSCAFYFVR